MFQVICDGHRFPKVSVWSNAVKTARIESILHLETAYIFGDEDPNPFAEFVNGIRNDENDKETFKIEKENS